MHLDNSNSISISQINWDKSIQLITYDIIKKMESLSKDKLSKIFYVLHKNNDGSAVFKECLKSLK